MALKEKIVTDVAVATIINLAQKIRGLVFIPLITTSLGAAAYGAFVQVTIIASLLAVIFRFGLDSALVRYMQNFESRTQKAQLYYSVLFFSTISGIAAAILTIFGAEMISSLTLSTTDYSSAFAIGALLIPMYIVEEMEKNYFRSMMNIKTFSILGGIRVYLEVATIAIIVILLSGSVVDIFYGLVIVQGIFITFIQIYILNKLGFHFPSLSGFRQYLNYSLPIMITGVFGESQNRADRLLIGYFIGPAAVGVYSIAYTIARLIRMFVLPLRVSFFAEFSRLWKEKRHDDVNSILSNGSRYFIALSFPSIFGLYLINPSFLELLSTSDVANEATPLLPILALAMTCIGFSAIYQQLFYAAERTRIISVIHGLSAFLNIVLNIILIPTVGIFGAAVSTLATFAFSCASISLFSARFFTHSFPISFFVKSLTAALVMVLVIIPLGIQNFVIIILIAPLIYFPCLILLGGLSKDELRFFASVAKTVRD